MDIINETTTKATTTTTTTTTNIRTSSSSSSSSSVRGASRKNRVYIFREWLIRNYGSYLYQQQQQQQQQRNESSSHDDSDDGILILDVAGGKGDLSWLLNNVDGLESIILDPWKQQDGSTTRNERMVKSIEFLCNNPDERSIRSVRGLSTYQPLAELIPKLLKQRLKRLLSNNNNNNNNNKSGENEYNNNNQIISELPVSQRPVTPESSSYGSKCSNSSTTESSSSCCVRPEDFVTPQLLQIPLNDEIVNQIRHRLIICKKNKDGNDDEQKNDNNNSISISIRRTDDNNNNYTNNEEEDGDEDGVVDEDDKKMISILNILSSGRIKLIVGFHPDQATESCIDLAKILNIPFCIVPCCVFPSEFPNRRLVSIEEEEEEEEEQQQQQKQQQQRNNNNNDKEYNNNNVVSNDNNSSNDKQQQLVPVRTYNQFLKYLRQKPTTTTNETSRNSNINNKILTAYLDFHFTETAKNVVLYTLPPSPPTPEED